MNKGAQIGAIATVGALAVAGIIGLTAIFGSWYTIDSSERGVLLTNGAITTQVEPGLGFKMPFIQSVDRISVQQKTVVYDLEAYSNDQQPATIRVSVNYNVPVDRVVDVRRDYVTVENLVSRVVERNVLAQTKTVFGRYKAVTAIQERARLNSDVLTALTTAVDNDPILISSVQIEDISFSAAYENSIEAKQLAEVEVQRKLQEAERAKVEALITVTQAQAEADSRIARAKAEAEAVKLAGEAEAYAIDARGKALRENPALVDLVVAERWDGKLPQSMPPNGTVPFLNLDTAKPAL